MIEFAKITGVLITETPLHIGTGGVEAAEDLFKELKRDKSIPAPVVRNAEKVPIIPASAMKGCLLRVMRITNPEISAHLFGTSHEDKGDAGALLFRDATQAKDQKEVEHFTRISIDRDTGARARKMLFTREYVPAGTKFEFEWIYAPRVNEPIECAFNAAARPLLETMTKGISIGNGSKTGAGKVRLERASYSLHEKNCTPLKRKWSVTENGADQVGIRLGLYCRGPYICIDPESRVSKGAGNERLVIKAMQEDDKPLLPGSSFYGALRAAAARHESMTMNNEHPDDPMKIFRPGSDPGDEKTMSFTERLFGINGWKGLLSIDSIVCTEAGSKEKEITGIRIDRFSGAVIDTGPFTVEPFIGSKFEVTLKCEHRTFTNDGKEVSYPRKRDKAFVEWLLESICGVDGEGLFLGWGAARGYGWFIVTKVTEGGV